MMSLPSSTFVPSRRTTSGTFRPTSFTAAITPSTCALEQRGDIALVPDEGELRGLCDLGGIAGAAARALHEQVGAEGEAGAIAREALQRLYSLTIGAAR